MNRQLTELQVATKERNDPINCHCVPTLCSFTLGKVASLFFLCHTFHGHFGLVLWFVVTHRGSESSAKTFHHILLLLIVYFGNSLWNRPRRLITPVKLGHRRMAPLIESTKLSWHLGRKLVHFVHGRRQCLLFLSRHGFNIKSCLQGLDME